MFREMNKKRVQANDVGTVIDYTSYESKLQDLIVELKGALLDIEMALQQSLEQARSSFVSTVRGINESIQEAQQTLMQDMSGEFINFAVKLKEELNREREQFVQKYEEDDQAALEEYGVTEITLGGVIEMLVDTENKDAVDEMVTQFQEKIEAEANAKDSAISKGW